MKLKDSQKGFAQLIEEAKAKQKQTPKSVDAKEFHKALDEWDKFFAEYEKIRAKRKTTSKKKTMGNKIQYSEGTDGKLEMYVEAANEDEAKKLVKQEVIDNNYVEGTKFKFGGFQTVIEKASRTNTFLASKGKLADGKFRWQVANVKVGGNSVYHHTQKGGWTPKDSEPEPQKIPFDKIPEGMKSKFPQTFKDKSGGKGKDGSKGEGEEKKKDKEQLEKPLTLPPAGSLEAHMYDLIKKRVDGEETMEQLGENVEKLLKDWGIHKGVTQVEVKLPDTKEPVKVGMSHNKFPLILKAVQCRTNIALVGPAGSGKTVCASKVAEALKLKFYSQSVSQQTGTHEFFGYQDANGNYIRTLFREAYEHGGVFLLDEFDAGNPNVLAALNQATANDTCAFADGMIPKHKDFVCIMAGNTFGHGATSEYVGRNKIDAATLDRFAFIKFPYDEALEKAIAPNAAWCSKVQAFRKRVTDKKIRTVVSPRATLMGGKLLAAGVSETDVTELLIYKGLSPAERKLLEK